MGAIPSLWKKIFTSLLVAGLLPLLGGSLPAIWLLWKHTIEDVEERHLMLARSVAYQIREFLKAHEVALAHLVGISRQMEEMPIHEDSILMDHMEALRAQGVSIKAWAVLGKDGRLWGVYPRDAELFRLDLWNRPEVQEAWSKLQQAYSPVHIPLGFSEPMVSVALPLGSTTVLGFIPLGRLNIMIQKLAASAGHARLILADKNGVLISHEDPLLVAQRFNVANLPPISLALEGNEGKTRYSMDGATWLAASAKVPELGWAVAVLERESSATAFLGSMVLTLSLAFSTAVVLCLILATKLGSGLLSPLKSLSAALSRISEGRYQDKSSLPAFQELMVLYGTFQEMVSELEKRESALVRAALDWQRTFDAVPDGIWLLDSQHRILRANLAACLLLDMKQEDLVGKHCFELVHSLSSPPEDCPHVLTLKSGRTQSAEQQVKGRTLLVTTAPLKDESGNLTGSVHLARDITQRKEMEESLRQSEERYRLVVENSQDGILVAQDGFIKFLNPRMLEIVGFSKEELTTRPFSEFIYPEDRPMVMERYRRRLQGDKTLPRVYRFRVLSGPDEIRWVEIRAVPIVWEGRQATLNFLTDITEKLKSEEALRQSEERYRSLVENSPDGIFMAEIPSGKISFVNQEICRIFGYSPEEALELAFWKVLPDQERKKTWDLLQEILQGTPLPQEALSLKATRKDGTEISIEVRVAFVHHQGRQVLQAVVRDVTEQKLLEKQLQHSQRMQALGTLAGGVAHEFNNLLAGIQGFAELLGFTIQEGQEGSEYVQEIISSCERAGNLTARMLSLARAEAGEKYPVKVNQVIQNTQKLLSQTLPRNIDLEVNLSGGLPFVMADATQLEQVLLNLALNSRDAMPQGGTLSFRSGLIFADVGLRLEHPYIPPGHFVEISVKDQGVGIPKEHLERVFEPFFTTKEAGKGTGLGLSVSYSIVKAHNGFIFAQSPPPGEEKGTLFRVLLPAVDISEQDQAKTRQEPPPPRGKGERILVVDDEARIREILKSALENYGYMVETASQGQEAAQAYLRAMEAKDPFQAVIMDLAMPVRDGKWAMGKILELDPGARFIVATGYTDQEFMEKQSDLKAQAVLRKPFDMGILLRTLKKCLEPIPGG